MMEQHSIAELVRFILPGGQGTMALLRAYFDSSMTTKAGLAERITVVGGYVGPEDVWLRVEQEWQVTKQLWSIEEFHLTDILAGQVQGVGRENADACVLSFAKIMQRSKLIGIVCGLRDDDWLAAQKTSSDARRFPTSYHLALHMAFGQLEDYMRLEHPGEDFAAICDMDNENNAETDAICDELRANPHCASVVFARRKKVPLLECADLCAGLARKEWLEAGFIPNRRSGALSYIASASSRGSFWSFETAKFVAERSAARAKRRAESASRQA